MLAFVNDSHSDLVSSIKLAVSAQKPYGVAVYSDFNLRILLFLAARGFIGLIKVKKTGPGGKITFKMKGIEGGSAAINDIWFPGLTRGHSKNRLVKYKSSKQLSESFSSEFVLVSTSRGLMTSLEAAEMRIGGLVVCVIT